MISFENLKVGMKFRFEESPSVFYTIIEITDQNDMLVEFHNIITGNKHETFWRYAYFKGDELVVECEGFEL